MHIIPTSDHNMHMDNSLAFVNAIINDLVEGANEPILTVDEYLETLNLAQDVNDYQADFDDEVSKAEKEQTSEMEHQSQEPASNM